MTLFELYEHSEINIYGYNSNVLRPPLTPIEVLKDIRNHWLIYYHSTFSIKKKIVFLVLRIFQRISYNVGWIIAGFKIRKKCLRGAGKL